MIVIPTRIPIAIHPLFWVFSGFIGWIYTQSLVGMLVWVGIIFFSVLIHELGHALTATLFKQKAQIQLVALGGLTSYTGPKLRFWQQFIITFNGPLFGFFLFLGATFLLRSHFFQSPFLFSVLKITQVANLFWTLINLLPVLPLDGGQLLRIVLEAFFGVKGFKASLLIGGILSTLLALFCFSVQAFLPGAFFFLFAFESFDAWRKSRKVTLSDRDDDLAKELDKGEMALKAGNITVAKALFEEVHQKGKGGLLAARAYQYLAFLDEKEGKHKEAYDKLLSVQDLLTDDAICLLHKVAALEQDHKEVCKLSSECYQFHPTQEVALRNAKAFAYLGEARAAGGWLQTAWQFGGIDLSKLLNESEFQTVKEHPEFKKFIDPILNS